MKKFYKIFLVVLIMILSIPLKVNAVNINSARIGKDMTVKTGDTFTIPLYLTFSDVSPKSPNSFGIGGVVFDLEYDDTVFKFIEANASGFNNELVNEDGEYAITSAISGEDLLSNSCMDNILYCGEYGVSITFYVKDTDKDSATIKIGEAAIIGWQLTNGTRDSYLEKDMQTYTSKVNKMTTITIKQATIQKEEPDTITKTTTEDKKELTITTAIDKKIEQNDNNIDTNIDNTKSNNNYLSKLEINDYPIDFYKRTNEYNIEVNNGVNKLLISAELEDKSALLEIVGANNLKANNNQVKVIVTAENGTKNTYTINVTYEDDGKKKSLSDINYIKKIKDFFIAYKLYIIIALGVLVLLTIISIIVNKINDNKLDDKFNNL